MDIDPAKLPAGSMLEVNYGSAHDVAEEARTGFQVMRPDGTATYRLNGEEITKGQYEELLPVFEAARQRATRDPRWRWVEATSLGQDPAHPTFVRGACRHIELEPVSGVDADMLFRCGTCGAYLQTVPPDGAR